MTMNIASVLLGLFLVILVQFFYLLLWKSRLIREKLRKQGINGPSSYFFLDKIREIKSLLINQIQLHSKENDKDVPISHSWPLTLFPHIKKWTKEYGPICLYPARIKQWLLVTDIEMVKEMNLCNSLNLGKPSYLSTDHGTLLGQGILTSNGKIWDYQRRIIAPELCLNKVKGMVNLIVDSINTMINSWETRLENQGGGVLEIKVDDNLRSLSAEIIAKACFGSNYTEGKEIFTKLRDLQNIMSKITARIPGFRYLPIQRNREMWRSEQEINTTISELVKRRMKAGNEQDLLQMILEGKRNYDVNDGIPSISQDKFIIDNCKNIFIAGHETTAVTASWSLMLLALHQDWQDRARAEVHRVCGNGPLDANMLQNMKTLTMVIQETLRLYPPQVSTNRAALQDIKLKDILIPKGVNIQIPVSVLLQDPDLWGPDAHKFKPERFANGISGVCKTPLAYSPFGIGHRVCAGHHFAMIELTVILSLILLKFRFSLSSSYQHSPAFGASGLGVEPGHGVILKMSRIN